jgi:di/tricarboxylate transporter
MSEVLTFADLGPDAWFAAAVLVAIVVALAKDWLGPDAIMGLGLAACIVVLPFLVPAGRNFGIEAAVGGFGNTGVLTVAALFIVAAGIKETGGMGRIMPVMLGKSRTVALTMIRLMVPTSFVSAFLNNTPVVAMFTPVVREWAKRNDAAPSKLLIPLSYASILGGTCTLIGTSTNLVVSGLMVEYGLEPMGMFEITRLGLPWAIIGLVFMITVGHKLLPTRKDITQQLEETRREYLVEVTVDPGCPLVGKSIEAAGLRHLKGLFLVHIERGDRIIGPVQPTEILEVGDNMLFTGLISTIVDLKAIKGLRAVDQELKGSPVPGAEIRLFEAVIASTSPLVGRGIREAGFRGTYEAAVIAVHRAGHRIRSKIGDIVLRSGDTILLEASESFAAKWYHTPHFYLVSQVGDVGRVKHEKAPVALLILVAMIALPSLNIIPMVVSAFLAAGLFVAFKIISPAGARRALDLQVLITIAAAFGIGRAMEVTGLAQAVAGTLIAWMSPLGPAGVLAGVLLATSVFTEIITNNAAAALVFPIAFSTAQQMEMNPTPFLIGLAVAASASFATPLGYQTNLIVYGPGGYKFSDFLRVGVPMNILMLITTVSAACFWWDLF